MCIGNKHISLIFPSSAKCCTPPTTTQHTHTHTIRRHNSRQSKQQQLTKIMIDSNSYSAQNPDILLFFFCRSIIFLFGIIYISFSTRSTVLGIIAQILNRRNYSGARKNGIFGLYGAKFPVKILCCYVVAEADMNDLKIETWTNETSKQNKGSRSFEPLETRTAYTSVSPNIFDGSGKWLCHNEERVQIEMTTAS